MSKDTSGTAFPLNADGTQYEGLTKRQWFAGLAMQGAIASQTSGGDIDILMCAKWCFKMADAMLDEGSK